MSKGEVSGDEEHSRWTMAEHEILHDTDPNGEGALRTGARGEDWDLEGEPEETDEATDGPCGRKT